MTSATADLPVREPAEKSAVKPDMPSVDLVALFRESTVGDVLAELDRDLVGLTPVKTRIREIAAQLLVERARTIAHRFIADGDHVVVEAKGDNLTRTGVRYDNDYCLVFRLENGKIKEVREYCDSVLTEKALGRFPSVRQPLDDEVEQCPHARQTAQVPMIPDVGVPLGWRLPQINRHDVRDAVAERLRQYRQPHALAAELRLQQAAVAAHRDLSCGEDPLQP